MTLAEWLERHEGEVGLAAADLVESTSLLYEVETVRYSQVLRQTRVRSDEVVASLGGVVVDHAGDGVLALFPDSVCALRFASAVFAAPGHDRVRVRAGVHCGSVRIEGGILVGRAIHLCARVMDWARGEPAIWVSEAARARIDASGERDADLEWLASAEAELKGVPGRQRLWRAA